MEATRDLGAGVRVEHRVATRAGSSSRWCCRSPGPVAPLLAGVPDRHQRVHGLAGLGDRDDQRRPVEDRVAVAELAGQLDLAGDPGPVLDRVLGDQPGVVGRPAGDDDDLVDLAQLVVGQPHLVQGQRAVRADPAEQRVGDRLRLLGDLLEHEVVVAALLGGGRVPVDVVVGRTSAGAAVEVGDRDPRRRAARRPGPGRARSRRGCGR